MEQVYEVNHQINNVFLARTKERILQTLISKEKSIKETDNLSKREKEDSILDSEKNKTNTSTI